MPIIELDPVVGSDDFQPDWGNHLPVIHRYGQDVERWRSLVEATMPENLRKRSDAATLVDKYLWTMAGESGGNPTAKHDSGNGYGLMADRVSRTPVGTPPEQQLANAWRLVANNPTKWTDWGEGELYLGRPFGALGVIAPYDPNPDHQHPTYGGNRAAIGPNQETSGPIFEPQGWSPPVGWASNPGPDVMERLQLARQKRLIDSGVEPVPGSGPLAPQAYTPPPESKSTLQKIEDFALGGFGIHRGGEQKPSASLGLPGVGLSTGSGPLFDVMQKEPPGVSAVTSAVRPYVEQAAELGTKAATPWVDTLGNAATAALGINAPAPSELAGKAAGTIVPQTYGDWLMTLGPEAGKAMDIGGRLVDEGAVRLAANETFDRLMPAAVLRHERAGAAIAQEAAGFPVTRGPFARTVNPMAGDVVAGIGGGQAAPEAGQAAMRLGGAQMGRDFAAEVGGGQAGRAGAAAMERAAYVDKYGEEAAAKWEQNLASKGLDWADYGDLNRNFANATPEHLQEPASASVSSGKSAINPDGTTNFDQLRSNMRKAVEDVRAEKAGQSTAVEMRAAMQRARRQGAQLGQEFGPEVGGGRATAGLGEPPARVPGRPADAQTDEAWGKIIDKAASQAQANAKDRFWYDRSASGIMGAAHGDVHDADLIARIAAEGSNQTNVPDQGANILRAWRQFQNGEPITLAHRFGPVNKRIEGYLKMSPEEWDARIIKQIKSGESMKTANFWLDMMDAIDPARAARIREESGAITTVDAQMMRAFGYGDAYKSPTAAQYRVIADGIKQVADRFGWTPKQAQAAIWVNQLVNSPTKPIAQELASIDYGTSMAEHAVSVNRSALPSPGTPRYQVLEQAYQNAPAIARAEHAMDVEHAFLDPETGRDLLAQAIKLPVAEPGVPLAGAPKTAGLFKPQDADLIDSYVIARMAAKSQDEGNWLRAFNLKSEGLHNAAIIKMGRPATEDELSAMRNELADLGGVVVQQADDGMHVWRPPADIDYAARANGISKHPEVALANKTLQARIDSAAKNLPGTIEAFAADGRTVTLHGDSLTASTLNRPDIRELVDSIRQRISAADDAFAARWGNPAGADAATADAARAAEQSRQAARLQGARVGQQFGPEVAGGSALRPGRSNLPDLPQDFPTSEDVQRAGLVQGAPTLDELANKWGVDISRGVGRQQREQLLQWGLDEIKAEHAPRLPIPGHTEEYRVGDTTLTARNFGPADGRPGASIYEVSIERAGAGGEFTGRAQGSDIVSLRGIGEILNDMKARNPDSVFVAIPTDARRAAVYQRAGFRPPTEEELNMGRFPASMTRQEPLVLEGLDSTVRPPQRPTTSWTIRPAEGNAYQVQTNAGPVSSSPEEAQARLQRNTAASERLNSAMATDRAAGRTQQAITGIQQVQQQNQVYRLAVKPEALTDVPAENELAASLGSKRIADPAGVRVLQPGEQPGPGEVVYFHGGNLEGPIEPGMFVTPNERSAQTIARLNDRLASVQDIRQQGARQGRFFGGEVGGGSAFPGGAPGAAGPTQGYLPGMAPPPQVQQAQSLSWGRLQSEIGGLVGLPRTLMTSGPLDFSALMHNMSFLGARHPTIFKESAQAAVKAYGSEEFARAVNDAIQTSQLTLHNGQVVNMFDEGQKYGLRMWSYGEGIGSTARAPGFEALNESTVSKLAEKLPWVKGAERSYATGMNLEGMRVWEQWAPGIMNDATLSEAQKTARLTDLASVINHARGFSGTKLATFLGNLKALFSGQYAVSRFQALTDPLTMALRGSPEARNLAAQSLLSFGSANAAMLGLLATTGAAAGGAWSVNFNPTSSDFGQLKIGNTRFDTLAGLGPVIKLVSRIGALGSDKAFGTDFARDRDMVGTLLYNWFTSKEQPVAKVVQDFLTQNKLPKASDLPSYFLPMLASDIVQTAWQEHGWMGPLHGEMPNPLAVPAALASAVGIGSSTYQNYEDQRDQAAQQKYGRKYDDLTREERVAAIAAMPDEGLRKQAATVAKKQLQTDLEQAGYKPLWDTQQKAEFFAEHPDLEVQHWYLNGTQPRNIETVDRILATGITDKGVRYPGVTRDINATEETKKAWADSKDIFDWYDHTLMGAENLDATARRMYKKGYDAITDDQQSSVRSNIHATALKRDPEADAWLYWWGRKDKTNSAAATAYVSKLWDEYGLDAEGYNTVQDREARKAFRTDWEKLDTHQQAKVLDEIKKRADKGDEEAQAYLRSQRTQAALR